MNIKGNLQRLNGVILKSVPTPGPAGRDGVNGKDGTNGRDGKDAPSKDEIIASLKADNDFLREVIDKREWNFNIERDDMGFIKNITAISKMRERNNNG